MTKVSSRYLATSSYLSYLDDIFSMVRLFSRDWDLLIRPRTLIHTRKLSTHTMAKRWPSTAWSRTCIVPHGLTDFCTLLPTLNIGFGI
jgi:hypothetical protein